jgi:hypothetical protein
MATIVKGDRVVRRTAKRLSKRPPIGVVVLVDNENNEAAVHWRHKPYRVPLFDLELADA